MGGDARQFRDWLKKQRDRDDQVGTFARLALADPTTGDFGTLIGYWVVWADDEELEDSAYEAIREYDAALPGRRVLPP